MRSGQLAHLTGVSTDTLRHYERLGLLPHPQRTPANYREYPAASAQRVGLIRRALTIGFSLSELKTILTVRDRGGAPCQRVRKMLNSKITKVEEQLEDLALLRAELHRLAKDWDRRLRQTKHGEAARLLESVPRSLHVAADFGRPPNRNEKGR